MFYLKKPENFRQDLRAAGCLAVKEGKILLLKRPKQDRYPDKWGFPSGRVERGENPCQAVLREIEEETGLEVDLVEFLGKAYLVFPKISFVYFVFRCDLDGLDFEIKLSHEHVDFKFQNPNEIFFPETVMDTDKVIEHFFKR